MVVGSDTTALTDRIDVLETHETEIIAAMQG
jgi:hypothetical protein